MKLAWRIRCTQAHLIMMIKNENVLNSVIIYLNSQNDVQLSQFEAETVTEDKRR